MEDENPEEPQRWTARRRAALVTSILKGETSAQEAARKHGLTVAEVEDWREKFLAGAENALRSRPRDDEEQQQEQLRRLKQKVADLVIEVDVLREATKNRPFVLKKSEE
jgi:transposase-like protein